MNRVLTVLFLFGAPAALAMPTPVSDLSTSCTYNGGVTCTKTYDSTSGVCRTIRFATSAGEIQVLVCDKTDHYELYRQSYPSGITFKACVGGGSVDQISGFSSFTSTTLGSGCGVNPLVDPNSTGFGNQTRAHNHAKLLDIWWDDPQQRLVQPFDCAYGTCAWVPWYSVSHSCNATDLKPLSECGGNGSASPSDNCMVSDEFSQVFLATAQGTNATRVRQMFNTLRLIASGNNRGAFGTLPSWLTRRTANTVMVHSTDSASDADARILLALYVAASSTHFPQTDRDTYRNHANAMAADFYVHDFRHECRFGRNGAEICDWPGAGGEAIHGDWDDPNFSYAGYYGDAAIALLAAHKSLNDSRYLEAARDAVDTYLLAAGFNGSFRVPPKAFLWNTFYTPQRAECTDTCNGAWDDSDAPRSTSICKAKYYAKLLNVTLPPDLDLYCNAWRGSGGVTPTSYKIQYTWSGAPLNEFQDGPYENGLALSLDFAYGNDLVARLDQVGTKWNGSNGWWGQTCMGVYRNAFFTTNLGSAIGRDMNAFR